MMMNPEQTIGKILDRQGVVFISSIDADGFPNTKAVLAPRKKEGIKHLYFTTNTSSSHVAQYRENPKSNVYFCDKRFFKGVMLKGSMEIIEDPKVKEMIWQDGDTMYYSKGVEDPDYCVLKFTAETGRYYSDFKSEDFIVS
ncbi:MAG: pyridoxamine 5'-phosphate oxidase family protein [Synergistaceae bacterium]|jgi:Uncharacterized stress protein (general stress protein 26)|nr:pyridoxamine 5'-phosphate oxidase family protein [Synergistaceae bacterium]MBP9626607.1 pyridoxamine 5'-phosphate oxidase family protein [Synergistaceae bacterium]MBP9957338.1 pyridoxamine 5'-phosphate oxidase family protein [Synergistaceae bacterium]